MLDNVPGARERAERGELAFGTVDSWLIYRLTGGAVHVTDATNASRTMLYNLRDGRWDPDLLREFDVPESMLPRVRPSSGVVGTTERSLLGAEAPIAGMAGDQQAALFGQGCFHPGMAKNTYGTGSFVLLHTGGQPVALAEPADHRRLADWETRSTTPSRGASSSPARPFSGCATASASSRAPRESESLAASVDSSDGVYLVPAFVGLGAPHWDQYARGAILGITRGTTRAHIARATLESIAFQTRDVVEAMERESGVAMPELRVDGGAARNDLLMQIQADILGRPVVRAAVLETTALGAAYLAGLGVGLWSGTDELARLWRADRTFEPQMNEGQREELYGGWKRAVERAKGWARD